ncbi:hemerythrin [Actinoplanes ianthinogenes]|uniref:Hemerythrin n=1 Tax=Actinoplanes ianthinogenes TaxID=122358 RepID=A0ABM7LMH1_9ACTN|nr:hemerythrin domain-containing protein [Actinoplanes ianthinogenes]BCJ40404.1 hemerythrin [Actinoplanes ianthinogenes]GGR12019.1 hemerythrin [Actinoplanes ianthinogenes]
MADVNLPPLPPVAGSISGRSVVDVLTEQHRAILDLTVNDTTDKSHSVLIAMLSRHLSAEEQYLYPAIREAVPDGDRIADRELAEDHALLLLMKEDRRDELAAAIHRHVEADTTELLPLLEQMVPADDMIRLGNRVETAEEAAPTRPHPGTPATPPWNKVVDPLIGAIDKLRDVATGRTTYPRDL